VIRVATTTMSAQQPTIIIIIIINAKQSKAESALI
jgi:hypothetical protein